MIYEGKITTILPQELVGANQIPKRTVVLEEITDKERKGGLAVDFFKDKASLADDLSVGDSVKVHINTRVNEYKGRRYNSITCWKVEKSAGSENANTDTTEGFKPATYDENLPF